LPSIAFCPVLLDIACEDSPSLMEQFIALENGINSLISEIIAEKHRIRREKSEADWARDEAAVAKRATIWKKMESVSYDIADLVIATRPPRSPKLKKWTGATG